MKLDCDVEIACYVHNSGRKGRSKHSCLVVGHHTVSSANGNGQEDEVKQMFILVCTASNKKGVRYKVSRNIVNLFTKCRDDGKATIRFKEPPHDIIIKKADPLQLKSFLLFVTLGKNEKMPSNLHVPSISSHPGCNVVRPKTKLSISKQVDYPLSKGFPPHLVVLRINSCNLKKIDSRIFGLKHLEVLDLSNNCIRGVPWQIEALTKLKEISLSCNQLKAFPMALCRCKTLQASLQSIVLDHNEIEDLPREICYLQKLTKLSLAQNLLTRLPVCIGNLRNLLEFRIPYNDIEVFPSSIANLSLSFFDISGNPLSRDTEMDISKPFETPSLLEQCCRKVFKHRIPYSPSDIPETLCERMRCYGMCSCGNPVFQGGIWCWVWLNLQNVAHTIQFINGDLRFNFPMVRLLCSPSCIKKGLYSRK